GRGEIDFHVSLPSPPELLGADRADATLDALVVEERAVADAAAAPSLGVGVQRILGAGHALDRRLGLDVRALVAAHEATVLDVPDLLASLGLEEQHALPLRARRAGPDLDRHTVRLETQRLHERPHLAGAARPLQGDGEGRLDGAGADRRGTLGTQRALGLADRLALGRLP